MTISFKQFKKATGNKPIQDDLKRVNCSKRGIGHDSCGWCVKCDAPYFYCGGIHAKL